MVGVQERSGIVRGGEEHMEGQCDANIEKVIALARRAIILADKGEGASRDNTCALLYGIVRDCGYRMRVVAEKERDLHRARKQEEEHASRQRGVPGEPCPQRSGYTTEGGIGAGI